MRDLFNKSKRERHQFKSYYCLDCKQVKPCGVLNWEKCCACFYQGEREKSQDYLDYQSVYQQEVKDHQTNFKQLQLLKNYSGCSNCGSKEVDAYFLYDENKLVCQPCRMKKEGGANGSVSFLERQK